MARRARKLSEVVAPWANGVDDIAFIHNYGRQRRASFTALLTAATRLPTPGIPGMGIVGQLWGWDRINENPADVCRVA